MGGYAASIETLDEGLWLADQLALHHKDECYTLGLNIDFQSQTLRWESGAPFNPAAYTNSALQMQAFVDPNDAYVCLTSYPSVGSTEMMFQTNTSLKSQIHADSAHMLNSVVLIFQTM